MRDRAPTLEAKVLLRAVTFFEGKYPLPLVRPPLRRPSPVPARPGSGGAPSCRASRRRASRRRARPRSASRRRASRRRTPVF